MKRNTLVAQWIWYLQDRRPVVPGMYGVADIKKGWQRFSGESGTVAPYVDLPISLSSSRLGASVRIVSPDVLWICTRSAFGKNMNARTSLLGIIHEGSEPGELLTQPVS